MGQRSLCSLEESWLLSGESQLAAAACLESQHQGPLEFSLYSLCSPLSCPLNLCLVSSTSLLLLQKRDNFSLWSETVAFHSLVCLLLRALLEGRMGKKGHVCVCVCVARWLVWEPEFIEGLCVGMKYRCVLSCLQLAQGGGAHCGHVQYSLHF